MKPFGDVDLKFEKKKNEVEPQCLWYRYWNLFNTITNQTENSIYLDIIGIHTRLELQTYRLSEFDLQILIIRSHFRLDETITFS